MSRKKQEIITPEWSHLTDAEKIGTTPVKLSISPSAEERRRLAKRMGLSDLKNLEANLVMSRDGGSNIVFISGQIMAQVTQPCAVTGKPVNSDIQDSFEAWYADPEEAVSFARAKKEKLEREGENEMPFLDESEDPEPIIDGKIDIGELVAQYLSLAINPYPHAEGVLAENADEVQIKAESPVYENPFAALKDWKARQDKG